MPLDTGQAYDVTFTGLPVAALLDSAAFPLVLRRAVRMQARSKGAHHPGQW